MSAFLHVRLPLQPQHKGRPECKCRPLGAGRTMPYAYTAADARKWMEAAARHLRAAWADNAPLNGPLRLTAAFVRARPGARPAPTPDLRERGHWHVSRDDWAASARVPAPTMPDLDNYEKALLDALTKAGIWHDDAQVTDKRTSKWYAAAEEQPCVEVRVEPL